MKHTLQLRLSQHLTLTPQLQQSIRLLQLSTLELNQELGAASCRRIRCWNARTTARRKRRPRRRRASRRPTSRARDRTTREESEDARGPAETPEYDAEARADRDWMEDDGGSYGSRDDSEEPDYPQLPAVSSSLREHLPVAVQRHQPA